MALAKRASKLKDANRFFVADDVHPQTLDVVRTRAETFGFDVIVDKPAKVLELQGVFGVLLQQVGTTGELHDYSALLAELKTRKIITSVAADIMALVLLAATGQARGRRGIRFCATLRRTNGLRWPTRGVLRLP
ncbi:hypothetical protein HA402_002266 [Bradysia odoriphaga]|nr:hypothetical protein HA402_002266 [Bradysia odoriphaga]